MLQAVILCDNCGARMTAKGKTKDKLKDAMIMRLEDHARIHGADIITDIRVGTEYDDKDYVSIMPPSDSQR